MNTTTYGPVLGSISLLMLHKWFHEKRLYLEALENQLKALEKAVDTVISQRKTLAEACGDFSASLHSLATVELSPALSGPLEGLSELQMRIRELYDRQAQQDVLTLGIVIDEYIRMIGSCKMAFTMREKRANTPPPPPPPVRMPPRADLETVKRRVESRQTDAARAKPDRPTQPAIR